MSARPLANDQASPASDEPRGWDAYSVWRTRVLQPEGRQEHASTQGWDPYLVWMSRVKR